jgi:AcrR family transcriptional regulator
MRGASPLESGGRLLRRCEVYATLFALMASGTRGTFPPNLRPDDGRLERGRRSRQRIREAARALFRERGFDATTLRAIAARAGMGASSIYRHIRTKEELLVDELAEIQEQAWVRFRAGGDRGLSAHERIRRFLDLEHALLIGDPDLTVIALRATTHPETRVSRRVLALQDRTVGLVTEILQAGRTRGELDREVDPLVAARAITHITSGARIAWANGLLTEEACRSAIDSGVELLFRGLQRKA